MTAHFSKRIVVSFALLLAGSTSVLAADAQAFADRLKEVASKSGLPLAFAGAESAGDDVVIKGLTAGTGPNEAKIGDVTFEGVTGSNEEGWKVESVPFADIDSTSENDKKAVVTGMVVEGLQLAGTAGTSTLPGEAQYFFDSAAVEGVSLIESGKEVFTLSGTSLTNTVASGSGEIATNFQFGDFKLDFAALPADEMTKTMQEVGYPQLAGTAGIDMAWNPKSGELRLKPLEVSVENAGDFTFAYQINGYTPAFSKSLAQLQEQVAKDPAAAESSGMAIIGLISQLSIASLQVDFTDASLTGKLLDYYSKQSGQTREQLVAGLTGMMPGLLGALQNPEFQTEVSTAVEAFLKDPQSISISMEPDAPVAATQIIGAAMGAPQTLPTVLQLNVTANEE